MSHLLCFNLAGIYTMSYRPKTRSSPFQDASLLRQAMCCEIRLSTELPVCSPQQCAIYQLCHFNSRKRHSIYAHAQHFPSKRQEKCLHILSGRKHKRTALHNHTAVCRMKEISHPEPFFLSFLESALIDSISR